MNNHKSLLVAAIVVSSIAAFASSAAYLHSVSQSSRAASSRDVQTLLQQYQIASQPSQKAILSIQDTNIKPAGKADLKKDYAKVDKAILNFSYTNTTGKDLVGAQLLLKVSSKSNYGIGSTGDVKLNKEATEKSGSKGMVFDLPAIKAGATKNIQIPLIVRQPGQVFATAEIQVNGVKIADTQQVTVNVN